MEQAVSEKRGGKEKNEQRFFLTEEELVQIIIRSGKRLGRGITHRRLNVLSEFESSAGRADVVFYILRKKGRKDVRVGRLPARGIDVLRSFPFRKRFSLAIFASLSGGSRQMAAKSVIVH